MEHRAVKWVGVVLLAMCLAAPATADPPSINALSGSTSLSTSDAARVDEYARFWSDALGRAASDPAEVRRIRRELLAPVSTSGTTEIFRAQYGRRLIPQLESVLEKRNTHTSINALIILAELGTEPALESLLERCAKSDEPSRHLRLVAARGATRLFSSQRLSQTNPNKITGAVRDLLGAVRVEDDYLTLQHQLEAILAAEGALAPDGPRDQVRRNLAEAIQYTAGRAQQMPPPQALDMMRGIYPIVTRVRTVFLSLPPGPPQQEFGQQLGPALFQLLRIPDVHWDTLQSNRSPDGQPADAILLYENSLSTVDAVVRSAAPLPKVLEAAWKSGDRAQYRAALSQWERILGNPPYGR